MKTWLAAASALALCACTTYGTAAMAGKDPSSGKPADLVIENVTVISPDTGATLDARDVAVRGGRIVSVLPASSSPYVGANKIDGSGKYLIPGLFDMHAHSSFRPVHESTLKMMTANGVTGIREMGSDCPKRGGFGMCIDEMRVSQARIEAGVMVGPRIVELSTAKISSNSRPGMSADEAIYRPMTPEQAKATVAALAARKPDILKINQDFMPDAFRALMTEAKARGIKVGGHIPLVFSVADVADMGMTSIEHARDLPMDCSATGATFRAHVLEVLQGKRKDWPDRKAIPGKSRDTYDEATCKAQIDAMVKNGTYYVPTHLTREMDYRASDPAYRNDPRRAYLPAMQLRQWDGDLDRTAENLDEVKKDLADFFDLGLKTTGMAHKAGVKVMAGTDANDTMVFPGFSLHDELRHLVAAGLTPMQALAAATSVPAEYLGRTGDFGGIATGKLADMVLLSADPTANIANTTAIAAVIQGGKVYDRAALDKLLAEVKEASAGVGKE